MIKEREDYRAFQEKRWEVLYKGGDVNEFDLREKKHLPRKRVKFSDERGASARTNEERERFRKERENLNEKFFNRENDRDRYNHRSAWWENSKTNKKNETSSSLTSKMFTPLELKHLETLSINVSNFANRESLTSALVKSQFKKTALRCHPDVSSDLNQKRKLQDMFIRAKQAHDYLRSQLSENRTPA